MNLLVNRVCSNCPERSGIDVGLCDPLKGKLKDSCDHPRSRRLAARAIMLGIGLTPQKIAMAVRPPAWADVGVKTSSLTYDGVMVGNRAATFVIVESDEHVEGKNLVAFDGTAKQLEDLVTHR